MLSTRSSIWAGAAVALFVLLTAILLLAPGCGGVPSDAAATVNGVVIKKDDVDDRIRVARGIAPQNVPADTASQEYNDLQRDITEQIVSEELEKQEAQKRGITVDTIEIDTIVEQVKEDKYLGDSEKMREDFEKRGLKEEDLRGEILRRLIHQKLLESLREEVPVSEQEVRAQYEANKATYVYPEKRQVRQIVAADQASAQALAARVAAGEDFATLAGQASIDGATKQNGGLLGLVAQNALPKQVGDVAFSLQPNQVSQPFLSEQRWYIVKVEFVAPASNRTYEEVKAELTQFASNQKLAERYKQYVEEVEASYNVEYAEDYSPREKEPGDIETPQPSLS